MTVHVIKRLQFITHRTFKRLQCLVGLIREEFQPDIDLALFLHLVDPSRHASKGKCDAVRKLVDYGELYPITVECNCLVPFVQRNFNRYIFAWLNHFTVFLVLINLSLQRTIS